MLTPLTLLFALPLAQAGDAAPKIVNGDEEADHPAVVSLGADFGSQRFSLCTGSIVTTRIILTAAHCGQDIPPSIIASAGRAFLGEDIEAPDHELRLVDMVLHPNYVPLESGLGGQISEFDLAVVVLEEDAPVAPIPLHLDPVTEDDLGREMLSVGYGASSGSGAGSGKKRSAVLILDDFDDQHLYTDANENPTRGNICSGDSGGPQMLQSDDGVWEQWAVHSWGYQGCGGLSASARADVAADWLMEQIEAVHGTTDLCEAQGLYTDDICDDTCEADPACAVASAAEAPEDKAGCSATANAAGWGAFALAALVVAPRRRRL
jgi:MYXO-CTERM domain-containing protein